jgi:branched-chain amino acid transport system substrate-binding protein
MRIRSRRAVAVAVAMAVTSAAAACSSSGSGSASGGSTAASAVCKGGLAKGAPIKLGVMGPLTGVLSANAVFLLGVQVRVAAQNAAGGIGGHKIVLDVKDDASDPTRALPDAQQLVSDGVLAIETETQSGSAMYPFLQSKDIPIVTYHGVDIAFGTDRNAIAADGSLATNYFPTAQEKYLVKKGVKNIALMGHDVPSVLTVINQIKPLLAADHINVAYQNTDLPFTSFDATSDAVAMKSKGVDGMYAATTTAAGDSEYLAAVQQGVKFKAAVISGLYDPTAFENPQLNGATALMGDITGWLSPNDPADAGAKIMLAQFAKYAPPGTLIQEHRAYGWIGTDVALTGMEATASCLTPGNIVTALRKMTSYTAQGMLAGPSDFASTETPDGAPFGTCDTFATITGKKWVYDHVCAPPTKIAS